MYMFTKKMIDLISISQRYSIILWVTVLCLSTQVACQHQALTQIIQQQQGKLQNKQRKEVKLLLKNKVLEAKSSRQNKQLSQMKKKQDFLLKMLKEQEANLQTIQSQYNKSLAQGQDSSTSLHILTSVNRRLLLRLAQEIGADSEKTSYGVLMKFGRVKTHVVFTQKNKVLMTQSRFKGFTPDLYFINEWNRTRRFSRAYLENGGVVILESEVDLEPGMSQSALKTWLKSYGLLVNFFQLSMHKNEKMKDHQKEKKGPKKPNRGKKDHASKYLDQLKSLDLSKTQKI
jgi:hypothetical protein